VATAIKYEQFLPGSVHLFLEGYSHGTMNRDHEWLASPHTPCFGMLVFPFVPICIPVRMPYPKLGRGGRDASRPVVREMHPLKIHHFVTVSSWRARHIPAKHVLRQIAFVS